MDTWEQREPYDVSERQWHKYEGPQSPSSTLPSPPCFLFTMLVVLFTIAGSVASVQLLKTLLARDRSRERCGEGAGMPFLTRP